MSFLSHQPIKRHLHITWWLSLKFNAYAPKWHFYVFFSYFMYKWVDICTNYFFLFCSYEMCTHESGIYLLKQWTNNHNPEFSNLIENYNSRLTTIILIKNNNHLTLVVIIFVVILFYFIWSWVSGHVTQSALAAHAQSGLCQLSWQQRRLQQTQKDDGRLGEYRRSGRDWKHRHHAHGGREQHCEHGGNICFPRPRFSSHKVSFDFAKTWSKQNYSVSKIE